MRLVSQTEFAKIIGTSAPYVSKIQSKLTLAKGKGKKLKIDLHGTDTIRYMADREAEKGKLNQIPEPSPEDDTTHKQPHGNTTKAGSTKQELESEKLRESIEKLKIENQQKRGALIDKRLVVTVLNKLSSIHENNLKALNVRLYPKINAIYSDYIQSKAEEIARIVSENKKTDKGDIAKILNTGLGEIETDVTQITEDETGDVLVSIKRLFDKFLDETETHKN